MRQKELGRPVTNIARMPAARLTPTFQGDVIRGRWFLQEAGKYYLAPYVPEDVTWSDVRRKWEEEFDLPLEIDLLTFTE
jgi:hypothetical protein